MHSAENDRFNSDPNNPTYGKSFTLTYYGPSSSLAPEQIEFKDGVILTDQSGNNYRVKATTLSYSPLLVDISFCADLDASEPTNNPDLNLDDVPNVKAPEFQLSDWPN